MPADTVKKPRILTGGLLAALLIGTLLRAAGIFSEPSIDELWSMHLAGSAWLEIPFLRHDNNHILNTLWLKAFSGEPGLPMKRLLALAAGVAIPFLGWHITAFAQPSERRMFVVLLSFSFPLIFYSSEARGYSLMLCLGMLSIIFLQQYFKEARLVWGMAFTLAVILASLAHFSFLRAYLAIALSSLALRPRVLSWALIVKLHAAAALGLALVYLFCVHGLYIAGGQYGSSSSVLLNTLALALGGIPLQSACSLPAITLNGTLAGVQITVVLVESYRMSRESPPLRFVIPTVVFALPCLTLLAFGNTALFPRYFLPEICLVCFINASCLSRLMRSNRSSWRVASGLLAGVVVLNLCSTGRFLDQGRGHVLKALHFAADHTTAPTVRVHAPCNAHFDWYLNYYQVTADPGTTPRMEKIEPSPQWLMILQPSSCAETKAASAEDRHDFKLAASYSFYGFSGESVQLYERYDAGK